MRNEESCYDSTPHREKIEGHVDGLVLADCEIKDLKIGKVLNGETKEKEFGEIFTLYDESHLEIGKAQILSIDYAGGKLHLEYRVTDIYHQKGDSEFFFQ